MEKLMNKLVSLCKQRGIIFPSSDIYGGIASCWDYGPVGIELKRNLKKFWWETMTYNYSNIVGIDASILMHPKVWEASGHISEFTDPLVDCKNCKKRFREDMIKTGKCPECGGELSDSRKFNLMFKTFMGPLEDDTAVVYLRPETAQGIYVNFQNVLNSSRVKIPFGIAQIGKAFRNEITPGNFIFRTREFEQMEMQFFIHPDEDAKWFEYWKQERWNWYNELGINSSKLRFHEHGSNELAHYAKQAFDIEYEFPFGWSELEGIHNRTDFDLKNHIQHSTKDLKYFDESNKEKYIPYIIETSAGCDRTLLVTLIDAYCEEENRTVLKFKPFIAPIKAGIFPHVKKDNLPQIALDLFNKLKKKFKCFYDEKGSIGRRYRRQDEIGTPFCITVDHQTLTDNTVTVRDRDTMQQHRLLIDEVENFLNKNIYGN